MIITLTPTAVAQVKKGLAGEGAEESMGLRLAAKPDGKGGIDYALGFDQASPEDFKVDCDGVDVLISPLSEEVLDGTVVDYAEVKPGASHFIFMNPNDPNYEPPNDVDYAPPKRAR
ncbi:MAG: iron-sulfur cluster assembly accessory protein [Gammaproteobacteria bacterium]|nr:MAG: iron-sulfur cluster assembly accessory protein [Gammaproteobacteria bacterium]